MTNVTIDSNFLIITNDENYELTLIINLDAICSISFSDSETKNSVRDLVFRLKDGSEKVIPFEDEKSAKRFIQKLISRFV
jgi:hypothetical protein